MFLRDKIIIFKCRVKKLYYKITYKNFKFSNNLSFRKGFNVSINGGNIDIKKNCFFNNYCSINSHSKVEIGEGCIFGEGVKIYDHNHKFGPNISISTSGYKVDNIKINNNVWVGSNVIILKGVEIGENSVIGANCLIYKDIPPNSIVKNIVNLDIQKII